MTIVGGTAGDLEAMRPVLQSMGQKIFHTGPLGSGEVTKLVNNIIGVTNLFLTVEAMLVARQYGMDIHRLAAITETSSGRNFSTQDWDRGKDYQKIFQEEPPLLVGLCSTSTRSIVKARLKFFTLRSFFFQPFPGPGEICESDDFQPADKEISATD